MGILKVMVFKLWSLFGGATGTTGTGKVVYDTSPTLVTPALGTPSSGTLTNATGLPVTGLTIGSANQQIRTNAGATAAEWFTPAGASWGSAVTTSDANADTQVGTSATTKKALVLQGLASQTANVFEVQGSNGTSFFAIDVPATTFTGTNATIAGAGAMAAATSADDNTVYGAAAGDGITTGDRNSLFGKDAGGAAGGASMSDSVFVGYQAGLLVTGDGNVGVGSGSLDGVTTGGSNTAIGKDAGGRAASNGMNNCVYVGAACGNTVTGSTNTMVGSNVNFNVVNTSTNGSFFGFQTGANVTGANNTLYGTGAASSTLGSGTDNVILGYLADTAAAGTNGAVAIGSGAIAAVNELVIGGSSFPSTNWYGGKGKTSSSATAYTINGTGGSGSNNVGANVQLAGGKGTGTAKGGNVVLQSSPSIGTGATAQTLYDRVIVVAQGTALTSTVATTVGTWTLASGSAGGGRIIATIRCTDGTDYQALTQSVTFALVNKAGTYTSSTPIVSADLAACSGGTLTATWSITAAGAVQVTATTSLTPSGTNAFVIYYTIENNSQSNVTLP